MSAFVLGISAYYHDSAAALVRDGVVIAAAQQERFTRVRHDPSFPGAAIDYCLDHAGIDLSEVNSVVYYEDPALKWDRVRSSFRSAGVRGLPAFTAVYPEWVRWKRTVLDRVERELRLLGRGEPPRIEHSRHHRSHAASAYFPSPFDSAAVLTIDGVGEWQTTTIWHGRGDSLDFVNSISYPHSLGLLYSAFTYFCGFKVDSGEYKLMGLAPYGEPRYAETIRRELIDLRPDGSFTLNMTYFEFLRGQRMVGSAFEDLFGGPIREPEGALTQRECDLAASVQTVTEEAVLGLARRAAALTGERRLCLAGGVALNCVANGRLAETGLFDDIWVQPAAGDAGCALGAALTVAVPAAGRPHLATGGDGMSGALLGPGFSDTEIRRFLDEQGYPYTEYEESAAESLYAATADYLAAGNVVGWFQGRMEFGPRALGARSILGDPRDPGMQKTMNLKIKFRESFRPFAPAVLAEDADKYFDLTGESPYMLMVARVADAVLPATGPRPRRDLGSINEIRSELPAVTHVDLSARVQTVDDARNPAFAELLRAFRARTGCSVLVNTSFNVRGEPIVRTPEEAYRCFMRTGIDVLVLGRCVLTKADQPEFAEAVDWRELVPLD
ncbi:carbamoyltransferase [Nocardia terpenica]|uniref:carbamoyltransferase family protein n=1 Tax=Nocardia terpenica TaxID=455432 RepID=UPI0018951198|nr:carbamoyltransferase [Nocardia terpenica]MBF6059243.1 carbamoyltransferase [Nocardia terpenica]MBF6103218.1 carbamoyltransferase [Nocardia terpenica]MBF6110593.1 carbamoyltransferase [Nocardia terpenica]MBF6116724.1 carbamoyltransferase [Nocardia terpenica]